MSILCKLIKSHEIFVKRQQFICIDSFLCKWRLSLDTILRLLNLKLPTYNACVAVGNAFFQSRTYLSSKRTRLLTAL
jgi:hypothetical protein